MLLLIDFITGRKSNGIYMYISALRHSRKMKFRTNIPSSNTNKPNFYVGRVELFGILQYKALYLE